MNKTSFYNTKSIQEESFTIIYLKKKGEKQNSDESQVPCMTITRYNAVRNTILVNIYQTFNRNVSLY